MKNVALLGPVDMGRAVPSGTDGYTPAWMTQALARHHPGAVVSSVEVDDVDVGTTTRIRLRLHYRAGDGPKTVLVKAQGSLFHRLVLATFGGLTSEVRFYAASAAVPIEKPVTYATGVNRRACQSVVVMEDLVNRQARPNNAVDPLDPQVVARGVQGLARLHGHFWEEDGRRGNDAGLGRVPPWAMALQYLFVGGSCASGVRRLRRRGVDLPAGLMRGRRLSTLWARSQARTLRSRPRTILHGDAHVGNTYSLPNGDIGFFDWQLIERGSWAHDVGYFLVSALDIEDRRKWDRDLLETYLSTLRDEGVDAPTSDAAWMAYRRTPAYGLSIWVTTLGISGWQRDDNTITTIKRFAAAYEDLATDDVL